VRFELLVDAEEFWPRFKDDIREARRKAYIQTFSFEGDRVGTSLARALERSPATDRRLLVDAYSLLYHSDRIIPGPAWIDRSLRREVMLTHRWVERLRRGGTGVRFSNPLGPSPVNLLRRNHKKIAVFDDRIAYVGGINFSDHNFAWHDMMLRVESEDLTRTLQDDFRATWNGEPAAFDREVGPFRVLSLNGKGNAQRLEPLIDAIRQAETSIDVSSAYISYPFTKLLAEAVERGVAVRVLTPEENNKANLARHILEAGRRHGFEVLRYAGGMSHMKAMVIDDELLVAGSSNFDFMSYHILEELVVMIRDERIMSEFKRRVWEPDLRGARSMVPRSSTSNRLGHAAVRLGAAIASSVALPQREAGV
jgi:cardiolipin synthase